MLSWTKRIGWRGRAILSSHQLSQDNLAFLIEFSWEQKKNGLSDKTIETRTQALKKLSSLGANLLNPDSVKTTLATANLSKGYHRIIVSSYTAFTKFKNINWKPPKTDKTTKEPFLPTNEEVAQLISGCGKNTATFLQFLDETGTRMGEALSTKWTDIDLKTKTVKINNPEKHGNTRTLPISNNLIAMLNSLKKRKDNNVFNPNESSISTTFFRSRRRIAKKLKNPRLLQIHFHTLRHRKATNEYYKTKDILHVKYILGHKSLTSTQQYAHYQPFQEEKYHCKVSHNPEETQQLIENGFEYVTEQDRLKFFRKRK